MALRASQVKVGDSKTMVVANNLSRTHIVMYAGASGDYNPIHSDERYTVEVAGYPSVFAHGMLSMGATGRLLTDWLGDGRLTDFGVRFVNQVWPGDTLTSTATIEAIRSEGDVMIADLSIVTVNQKDQPVVSGTASARLDP